MAKVARGKKGIGNNAGRKFSSHGTFRCKRHPNSPKCKK